VTVTVRPIVVEGDQVPFVVDAQSRFVQLDHGASEKFWYKSPPYHHLRSDELGFSSVYLGRSFLPAGDVGEHVIDLEKWTIWYGISGDETKSRKLADVRTTTASYKVVPREQAPNIELPWTPELHEQVKAAVKLKSLTWPRQGLDDGCDEDDEDRGYNLYAEFELTDVPCELAFDVFIKTDQEEIQLSSIDIAKGDIWGPRAYRFDLKQPPPARATVILRSNVDVARKTLNLTAIYSGQIEFADVPVEQEAE